MCGCHLQKKKEVAFLREKHLQIREGKWSCLSCAYPASFPSLICSTEFSLLDFLSFVMLRESARETEGLEQHRVPGMTGDPWGHCTKIAWLPGHGGWFCLPSPPICWPMGICNKKSYLLSDPFPEEHFVQDTIDGCQQKLEALCHHPWCEC